MLRSKISCLDGTARNGLRQKTVFRKNHALPHFRALGWHIMHLLCHNKLSLAMNLKNHSYNYAKIALCVLKKQVLKL